MVVLNVLPRVAPRRPIFRINRSTVQRATSIFSRLSCRQTFRVPYTLKFSVHTRRMSPSSSASRFERAGRRSGSFFFATCA